MCSFPTSPHSSSATTRSPDTNYTQYLMDARCLMATSRACTDSKGTGIWPLTRASCSMRQLTMASHLMETLKIRSFPSPGIVTSKSTFKEREGGGGSPMLSHRSNTACSAPASPNPTDLPRIYLLLKLIGAHN